MRDDWLACDPGSGTLFGPNVDGVETTPGKWISDKHTLH